MRGTRIIEHPSRLRRPLLLAATGLFAVGAATGCSGTHNVSAQGSDVGPVSGASAPPSRHHDAVSSAPSTAVPVSTGSSGSAATSAAAGHAVTPECKAASLSVSLGQGDAGMSQQHQALRFTNTGNKACVIVGFPGVSYVTGDSGRQVGAAATRDGKIGTQLTLQPGAVAATTVDSVDVGAFDASACKPTPVRGYRVYAPDDTAAMFVSLPAGVQGCAGTTPDPQLSVSTIVAGTNGAG